VRVSDTDVHATDRVSVLVLSSPSSFIKRSLSRLMAVQRHETNNAHQIELYSKNVDLIFFPRVAVIIRSPCKLKNRYNLSTFSTSIVILCRHSKRPAVAGAYEGTNLEWSGCDELTAVRLIYSRRRMIDISLTLAEGLLAIAR
jgi:hypothetical protein